MRHYIPYSRVDTSKPSAEKLSDWLGVDKLLAIASAQPPEVEFPLLVEFLAEFSGNVELAYQHMCEMPLEQMAANWRVHSLVQRKIKARINKLFSEAFSW